MLPTTILRFLKLAKLVDTIYVGLIRLKNSKRGDSVTFSGVVVKFEGIRYEIRGIIIRLD